jgi:hypothetical protein
VTTREKVKTQNAIFEDLIADFVIENGREPDLEEMAWIARSIHRWASYCAD